MIKKVFLAFVFASFCFALSFPALSGRVVDEAGILSQQSKSQLESELAAFEKSSSTQIVVATIKSLDGEDIAQYGYQLGRAWGIGQKGLDNGAILLVAPNERKVRIEVGYGLEGALNDGVSSDIIRNIILPRFRAGDFNGGIKDGVAAMIKASEGEFKASKTDGGFETSELLVPALVVGFMLLNFISAAFSNAKLKKASNAMFFGIFFTLMATAFTDLAIVLIIIFIVGSLLGLVVANTSNSQNFATSKFNDRLSHSFGGGFKGSSFGRGFSRSGGFKGGGGSFGGGGASGSW